MILVFRLVIVIAALLECRAAKVVKRDAPSEISIQGKASGVDIPMQKLMVSGPIVVNLMAQLAVISSQRDVDLSMAVPVGGFKYIQHPQSARATIVQISNEGWKAFAKAHGNMYKVQLKMNNIPSYLRTANKILARGSPAIINRLLPLTMNQLETLAVSSSDLCAEVYANFYDVVMLLGEVAVATTTAKGAYEANLEETQAQLKLAQEEKKQREAFGQQLKQQYEQTAKLVDRYRIAYQQAVDDIPSGFEAIFMGLIKDIAKIIPVVLQTVTMGLVKSASNLAGNSALSGEQKRPAAPTNAADAADKTFIVGSLAKLAENLDTTKQLINDKAVDAPAKLGEQQVYVKALRSTLAGLAVSDTRDQALAQLDNIGKLITDAASSISNSSSTEDSIDGLNKASTDLKPFTAANALNTANEASDEETTVASTAALDNFSDEPERYKAYLQLQLLEKAEARFTQSHDKLEKFQAEMGEFMLKMSQLNLETIRFEEIVSLLREGIRILGQLRTAWSEFTQFFQIVAARAQHMASVSLRGLLYTTNATADLIVAADGTNDRSFYLELFTDSLVDFGGECYILSSVASTYVELSDKFMVHKIAGLASLLAIGNNDERTQKMKKIEKETEATKLEIEQTIKQRKAEFDQKIGKGKISLETYLNKVGGSNSIDVQAFKDGQNLFA